MKLFKRFALSIIVLLSLTLVSCAQTPLSAPDVVTVEENVLRWNSVNGARSYAIAVDGLEKAQTTNTYYDLESLGLEVGITYDVQVRSIGDGYFYLNSEFSEGISVTYRPDEGGNDGGDGAAQKDPPSNDIPVHEAEETIFYKAHPNASPVLKDSFSDGEFYYYYYHLGYLENFPLVYSSTKQLTQQMKENGAKISFTDTISAESQSSIEDTVSNSVTESRGGSTSFEKGFEFEIEHDGKIVNWNAKGHVSVTDNWNWEHSSTYSTAHSVASTWATSSSRSVNLEFTEDTKVGYYRYVQYTKRCDVFALVVYDTKTEEFSWKYISYAEESIRSMFDMFEYSEDGFFDSDGNDQKLEFDRSYLANIDPSSPPEYKGPQTEDLCIPLVIPVNRHHCAHDTGYDLTTDGDPKNTTTDHSLFEMGHLVIYGCRQNGESYTIAEPENFKIEYVFEQDPENLPADRGGDLRISNDSSKTVLDTDIRNKTIGKGAYEVKIKYKNGSNAKTITVCDFMNGKSKGSVVDILTNSISGVTLSDVAEISITVVYELYFWASVFDAHHSDWRCDYVFKFE